jgi:hypothetical protein
MALSDELVRIAQAAQALADAGEELVGVLPTESLTAGRVYLCAYESPAGHAWLGLDGAGAPLSDRHAVREAAQIAGLCEIAEESAGGGDLPQLIARLEEIRLADAPQGIEEAEAAARALAAVIEPQPRLATPGYLDRIGAASRRLEQALGDDAGSPFAAAMQSAIPAVDELAAEVERTYKGPLA